MNAPVPRRRVWLRPLAATLLVFALLGGGWWAWKTWGSSATKPDEYIFSTVQRGDIEDLVGATGSLQPRDYVDVGAQISGQLKKLHVDVGTEVKEGQLLAEIDAEQSAARVDANRASLRAQQATLIERQVNIEKAERDLQRQRNLMAEEATTTEQVQNADTLLRAARTQLNSLRAQIDQQQASMRVEEANLKFTKIYAPMSGTVISVTARQGQTLNTNQSAPTLMRIADLSTMTVQTQVGEADVSKLRTGMPSYFTTLGSPGRRFYGSLRKIEPTPTVTNNVVLYNALFDVPNPNKVLMPQMTAQVFFVVAEVRDVLVVPMSALTFPRSAARSASTPAGAAMQAPGAAQSTANAPIASSSAPGAPVPASGATVTAPGASVPVETAAAKSATGGGERVRRAEGGERQRGMGRGGVGGGPPAGPRPAKVKVPSENDIITERDVMVGVTSRVSAEVVSGLSEGERIVIGVKVPDAPKRNAAQVKGATPAGVGAPPGGGFGPR